MNLPLLELVYVFLMEWLLDLNLELIVGLSLLGNCSGFNSTSISSLSAISISGLGTNMSGITLAASILPIMVPAFNTTCLLVKFLTPTATLFELGLIKLTSDCNYILVSNFIRMFSGYIHTLIVASSLSFFPLTKVVPNGGTIVVLCTLTSPLTLSQLKSSNPEIWKL